MEAIRIENLYKIFRGASTPVLKGIQLQFPLGKLTYILGASGSGKSVLLKHILGLLNPDEGEVWVEGHCLSKMKSKELLDLRLRFGMLFQNSALFDGMSIFDNIAFPLREHTSLSDFEILQKVERALCVLGMKEGWNKYPNELSGGMKKRVGLARAIIREPSILLYDEPTTGLDPIMRITVDGLIETLKRELKLTSIVISHDISSALRLADCIAFLDQGQIAFFGTPSEFKASEHPGIQGFLNAERKGLQVLY